MAVHITPENSFPSTSVFQYHFASRRSRSVLRGSAAFFRHPENNYFSRNREPSTPAGASREAMARFALDCSGRNLLSEYGTGFTGKR